MGNMGKYGNMPKLNGGFFRRENHRMKWGFSSQPPLSTRGNHIGKHEKKHGETLEEKDGTMREKKCIFSTFWKG